MVQRLTISCMLPMATTMHMIMVLASATILLAMDMSSAMVIILPMVMFIMSIMLFTHMTVPSKIGIFHLAILPTILTTTMAIRTLTTTTARLPTSTTPSGTTMSTLACTLTLTGLVIMVMHHITIITATNLRFIRSCTIRTD